MSLESESDRSLLTTSVRGDRRGARRFGEYRPIGYCRFVVLIAVVIGRLLEIVIIGVAANLLANSIGTAAK